MSTLESFGSAGEGKTLVGTQAEEKTLPHALFPESERWQRDLGVRVSGCIGTGTRLLGPCAKLPWLAPRSAPTCAFASCQVEKFFRDGCKFLELCLLKPDYKIGCGLTDSFMF